MITGIDILLASAALAALGFLTVARLRLRASQQHSQSEAKAARALYEQEIADAHEERNRLLDALGDAFVLVDGDGIIRFANAAAHDLFGKRELIRRPVREAFLDPRLAEALLQCLETGEPVQSRVVLPQQTSPRGDLETRGVNAWIIDAARLPAPPGGDSITRVIIRDVTTEHQTEQIRKDFVANASHELRTPMAIINGYLENLLDDHMLDEPEIARRFLTVMRKHADRISRIVEDMLVISRLESGEAASLKIEPFRLRSCIKDVLERLESVIRSQTADILVLMPDESLTLQGDRFYWTQVLFNLVENALKQNPHPGLRVEIGCESAGEQHRIWVADNGIGIPSADLPHIFRRFFRVEKHHSQHEIKGTGLGLSIVKRAIEAHGGSISVTSVPGRETKFLIIIPKNADFTQKPSL
ncbi:MAG: ATP-binding protein [Luteolibacter sp.]|jgi:two-component system phosphate regulon sensor histidine kinase PhoR|nr:ATP-binding protein [Luteolibacter sp.]